MFSDYDRWKLATPPEYEWPDDYVWCHGCGAGEGGACLCADGPADMDELFAFWDSEAAA